MKSDRHAGSQPHYAVALLTFRRAQLRSIEQSAGMPIPVSFTLNHRVILLNAQLEADRSTRLRVATGIFDEKKQ